MAYTPTLSKWKASETYTKQMSMTKQLFIFKISCYFTKGPIMGSIKCLHMISFDKDFPQSTSAL